MGDTSLQRHDRLRPLVQRADSQPTEPSPMVQLTVTVRANCNRAPNCVGAAMRQMLEVVNLKELLGETTADSKSVWTIKESHHNHAASHLSLRRVTRPFSGRHSPPRWIMSWQLAQTTATSSTVIRVAPPSRLNGVK